MHSAWAQALWENWLVPLAGLLGEATEELAIHTGPKIGGLLNATLGNAAELIITIVALSAPPFGTDWAEGLYRTVTVVATGSDLGGQNLDGWVKVFLSVLKLAGAGLVGAAGAAALRVLPASAATGGNFILGGINQADKISVLRLTAETPSGGTVANTSALQVDSTNALNLLSGTMRGIESIGQGTGAGVAGMSWNGPGGLFGSQGGPDLQLGGFTINEGVKLLGTPGYPNMAADFARTFRVLKSLRCDVFGAQHPYFFDMEAKAARLKEARTNPFVDPAGYRAAALT